MGEFRIFSVFCPACATAYRKLAEAGFVRIIDPADFSAGAPMVNDAGRPVILGVAGDAGALIAVSREHEMALYSQVGAA